jgi:hypothetical protein
MAVLMTLDVPGGTTEQYEVGPVAGDAVPPLSPRVAPIYNSIRVR